RAVGSDARRSRLGRRLLSPLPAPAECSRGRRQQRASAQSGLGVGHGRRLFCCVGCLSGRSRDGGLSTRTPLVVRGQLPTPLSTFPGPKTSARGCWCWELRVRRELLAKRAQIARLNRIARDGDLER